MTARFEGEVQTQWLTHVGPDRKMRLLAPFAFIDRAGRRWDAGVDDEVDGASIPDVLWSQLIGTPFVGDYRRATVLHDVYCRSQTRPHREVHRMFYEAMRTDGVPRRRARVMYLAVRTFGPTWGGRARAVEGEPAFDAFERAIDALLGEAPDPGASA